MRGTLSSGWKKEDARDRTLALVSSQSIIRSRTMENAPGPLQPIRTHECVCVCVCVWCTWGTDRGVVSRERNELLAETGAKAERLPLYESLDYPPPMNIQGSHGCLLSIRKKSIERGLYTISFENRERNKFKYRRFFDMLTRIVEERPMDEPRKRNSLILISFFPSFLFFLFHPLRIVLHNIIPSLSPFLYLF